MSYQSVSFILYACNYFEIYVEAGFSFDVKVSPPVRG